MHFKAAETPPTNRKQKQQKQISMIIRSQLPVNQIK